MAEIYKMVAVKSPTKQRFEDIKRITTINRGGSKTSDDYILDLLMNLYWNKGMKK